MQFEPITHAIPEESSAAWEAYAEKVMGEVKRIRYRALNEEPFFGVVGMRLHPMICRSVSGRAVDTCAVDGKNLYVNPEYFMVQNEEEKFTVYLHEVLHVALMHHLRREDRDPWWWNVAGDHAVNLLLKEKRLRLKDWLCDRKYSGWSAERIYRDVLENLPPEPGEPTDEPGEPGEPEEPGEPGKCKPGKGKPEEKKPEDKKPEDEETNEPEGEEGGVPPKPTEGKGTPGKPKPGAAKLEGQPHGEVWDGKNEDGTEMDEEQVEEAKKDLARGLNEAREIARQAGNAGSAGFRKQIDEVIVPSPNWKSLFADFWNAAGDPNVETWSRFNRRMAPLGIWMPGMNRDGVGHVVIFDDRSGSVGYAESEAFYAHTQALRDEVSVEKITLVPFNHVILQTEIVELYPEDPLPNHISSGGGTRFDACFNWLARQDEVPDKVIVLTDLGDTVTVDEPPCPVLWASCCPVYERNGYTNKPSFGDVIEIEVV